MADFHIRTGCVAGPHGGADPEPDGGVAGLAQACNLSAVYRCPGRRPGVSRLSRRKGAD